MLFEKARAKKQARACVREYVRTCLDGVEWDVGSGGQGNGMEWAVWDTWMRKRRERGGRGKNRMLEEGRRSK